MKHFDKFIKGEETYLIEMDYSIFRIPLAVSYRFPCKVVQPYISAGYSAVFLINRSHAITKVKNYETLQIYSLKHSELCKYQHGITGGIGIKYIPNEKYYFLFKGDFEYRIPYINTNFIINHHRVSSVLFSLGVGYKL